MNSLVFKRTLAAASGPSKYKVSVLGASGGIGQPLSLLLKQSPYISHLSLYDIVNTPGVSADLSHINTGAKVTGHKGDAELSKALEGCDVVVIPAGVPRKPGMTRDDLFNINASIVKNLASKIAEVCPEAFTLVISNPVNSTVPIVAETFKKFGTYNPRRVFGVTTLDVVRANTFVGEMRQADPTKAKITVVGGHSGPTIVPLLSQSGFSFSQSEVDALTKRIQYGGDEVVKAKDGAGSATLSMAYAGANFTTSLLRALGGERGIVEPTFVESNVMPEVPYFSSNVELAVGGVGKIHPVGQVNAYEQKLLDACIPELKKNIQKGIDFAKNN
ncbi:hypothetical protein MIR68_001154 [Amoeboaphelidium protococcarum]|nr:hypothetical protein MIR68_001154 [Amoeboaphelidium protococcarum]